MKEIYEETGIILPKNIEIPQISDERLLELYSKLKPIVTLYDTKYLLREFKLDELRKISYLWNSVSDKREIINKDKLELVEDFACLHKYGIIFLFKPSIYEVLAQVPEKSIEEASLFEIVEVPSIRNIEEAGYHLSKVRTYKLNK